MLSIPLLLDFDVAKFWAASNELHGVFVKDKEKRVVAYINYYSLTFVQPGLTQLTVDVTGDEKLMRDVITTIIGD